MATRILGPTGSKRRKRFLLVPLLLAAVASLFVIVGAQASPPDQAGFFELDKNLINNEQTPSFLDSSTPPVLKTLGVLGGNISAGATSFTVCQNNATNPATPITIQVDAERMTVGAIANASGGGCSGTFKRTYSSITRGVAGGGAAASHQASGVAGNVTQVTFNTVAGDDWNQVFNAVQANGSPTPANPNPCSGPNWTGNSAAQACDWINDPPGQTVFTTGGSKDDLDINAGTPPNLTPNWMYTNSSVPDADDINDGYAIKYQGSNPCQPGQTVGCDHQFLYFGADRTAVNGSKDMGFWFFKSPVSLNPDGTFSGQHTVGDILLLGTFTGGGATTTIRIFKWVGTGGDTNGTLNTGGNFGDCVPGGSSDGCNTVNNGTIKSPWAYQSKISGSPANTIYAGGAMEGGADLTSLNLSGCFSSFLVETRSSPSIGAQLKDFLLGKFEQCTSGLTTTPQDAANPPADLTDSDNNGLPDVSIGGGSVQVTDEANLNVQGSAFTGTLSFHICGPIASGTCDTGGVPIDAATGTNPVTANGTYHSKAATLTSVGRYCWRGDFTSGTPSVPDASDSSATECFEVLPVTPPLDTQAVSSPVTLGDPVQDNATLSGTATQPGNDGGFNGTYTSINATNGAAAGGHITFTLLGPNDCTTVTSNGSGTNPQDVNVSGNATYGPVSYTPGAVGTYHWKAQYVPATGDPNNVGSTHNADCSDTDEDVVVQRFPTTTTTRQFVYPQDKAKVTVGGGGDLSGSLSLRLFDTLANCQADDGTSSAGGLLYSEGATGDSIQHPISGAPPQFVTTNNTSVRITTNTTVYWNVTYTSNKASQPGSSSACEESTQVTYAGNDGTIAIP
jgi:hypothetical protein